MAWLLVDEHPDSINDGCFYLNPLAGPFNHQWGDLPGSSDNGACGFAFADGHSEIKKCGKHHQAQGGPHDLSRLSGAQQSRLRLDGLAHAPQTVTQTV